MKPALRVPAPPSEFVTVTSWAVPAVPVATVRVAEICVAETTVTLLAETPVPLRLIVAPVAKPAPWIVTGTAVPAVPLLGLTAVTVTAATTVNP